MSTAERPTAAVGTFPYPHRTLAEVWTAEALPEVVAGFFAPPLDAAPVGARLLPNGNVWCDHCGFALRPKQLRSCTRATCKAQAVVA